MSIESLISSAGEEILHVAESGVQTIEHVVEGEVEKVKLLAEHTYLDAQIEEAKAKVAAIDALNAAKQDAIDFLKKEKERLQSEAGALRATVAKLLDELSEEVKPQ